MDSSITYTQDPDNTREVLDWIGPIPPCPTCNDTGEYEGEYGPRGCLPCCSRLIPYYNASGKREYVDWGETLYRTENGTIEKE